eukprot:Amastigsp_a2993_21.p2 type:complete len:182 gc:universal Amastigsp_a2993_21:332-877(+)
MLSGDVHRVARQAAPHSLARELRDRVPPLRVVARWVLGRYGGLPAESLHSRRARGDLRLGPEKVEPGPAPWPWRAHTCAVLRVLVTAHLAAELRDFRQGPAQSSHRPRPVCRLLLRKEPLKLCHRGPACAHRRLRVPFLGCDLPHAVLFRVAAHHVHARGTFPRVGAESCGRRAADLRRRL